MFPCRSRAGPGPLPKLLWKTSHSSVRIKSGPTPKGKTMNPILEVRDVRKSYGDFVAVGGVSMSVPPGSIFGLLGPNGAGKTSTIRMIMNITAPDTGEILVFGRPRTPADLRRIGYLPEER